MTIITILNLVSVLLAMGLLVATVRFAGRAPARRVLPATDFGRQQTAPEPDTAAIERW
jgi:hypothetical protein